jgi:hypothetical protein
MQNYPNPFNPETKISYQLSTYGNVSLKVYDTLGREVVTLINELKSPGFYQTLFSANNFTISSGLYFYTLRAGNFSETRKMILLK